MYSNDHFRREKREKHILFLQNLAQVLQKTVVKAQVRWFFRFRGQTKKIHGSCWPVCEPSILSIRFSVFPWIPGPYITVGGIAASFLTKRIKCLFPVPWEAACIFWCRFSRLKTTEASVETTATRRFAFWWSRHAFISCPGTWARLIFEDKQAALSLENVMKFEGTKCKEIWIDMDCFDWFWYGCTFLWMSEFISICLLFSWGGVGGMESLPTFANFSVSFFLRI